MGAGMHSTRLTETGFADTCCSSLPCIPVGAVEISAIAASLMQSRRTILPKRLFAPGPNPQQIGMMFDAAATAPDHGQLLPWRFIVIPDAARESLATVFGAALLERDAAATPEQVEQAREKALRAPLLFLMVVDGLCGDTDIDLAERTISAGCAVQNVLLMATALGFGSALTSGKALKSASLRKLLGLDDAEQALCFVNVGTADTVKKRSRLRPQPLQFVSTLCADASLRPGFD